MIQPLTRRLAFAPTGEYVEATIVSLTPEMAAAQLAGSWWSHPSLKRDLQPPPIDRWWDWNAMSIDFDGRPLASEKVAIVTGDGAAQGAMMVSTGPVSSILTPGEQALFVELLFTAPWNRPALRSDGQRFFLGVGTELLMWAVWLSRESGHGGLVRLESSPDFVQWYQARGLQTLGLEPIVFEGVAYTPMELSSEAAGTRLGSWP